MPTKPGKIYLIGAGPGDPGLITVRGAQLLGRADIVLYDYLANPRILDHARADAERVCLGRHGHGRILSQEEIHERMIAAAKQGQIVARLKGGDPAIFGRTTEETAALEAAGVPYEIVPGVTAALAASSYAGVPLTHRAAASCVAFVTGQECRGKEGPPLDMAGLARFPGTLVFYMGVTSAPQWAAALVEHGKAPETPVVVERTRLRPPAIVIVGDAIDERAAFDWFAARPLAGQTIMVTRPAHQSDALAAQVEDLGAAVVVQPAIVIDPPRDWRPVDDAIQRLSSFGWIVFSSANGVASFLDRLEHLGLDGRALAGVRIGAIGPATAQALAERRLRADLQPAEYRAEALAESLLPAASGQRVLLVRASRGREVLAETLSAGGCEVEQVVAYESRDVTEPDPAIAEALAGGEIDWVTVTSSAIARSLVAMFGEELKRAKLAAISPLTAGVLADAGYGCAAIAEEYTSAGLVAAVTRVSTLK
jgi:uroporphyrinogen III methyltransferase/synthase